MQSPALKGFAPKLRVHKLRAKQSCALGTFRAEKAPTKTVVCLQILRAGKLRVKKWRAGNIVRLERYEVAMLRAKQVVR